MNIFKFFKRRQLKDPPKIPLKDSVPIEIELQFYDDDDDDDDDDEPLELFPIKYPDGAKLKGSSAGTLMRTMSRMMALSR